MDISDYTRIVLDKIQKFEPEHATKIIGYLLLRDEQELAQLASCPDDLIRQVAFKAKTDLQRLAAKQTMLSISPSFNPQQDLSHLSVISPRTPTLPPSFQVHSPYWDPPINNANQEFRPASFSDFLTHYRKQTEMFLDPVNTGNGGYGNDYYGSDASAAHFNGKVGRRLSALSEFPTKICHYFKQGYCKNGSSCRFYHGPVVSESFYGNEAIGEEPVISPGSLAQLESEIIELLKQKGSPISIASLPMAYYDKYKKVLQHDGYLTESQRHGKSGFSLTKLLVRLSNNIRLIDRPHGQHDVVLAEDAPKFIPKGEYAQNISASRQIYLTFPADSTFSEEDVSNYFNTFGCVQDVRIPSQQRRMFGFVTFVDSETVKTILDKGNPHYVRGSRVLVKPYREKGKINERKYLDRAEHPFCYSPHYADLDSELFSIPRSCGKHRALRRQLIEEQEQQALELQRSRFAEMQFAQKSLCSSPHFGFSMDDLRISDDHFNFPTEESFGYALDEKPKHTGINASDDNSNQGINLPDSPFSFQ